MQKGLQTQQILFPFDKLNQIETMSAQAEALGHRVPISNSPTTTTIIQNCPFIKHVLTIYWPLNLIRSFFRNMAKMHIYMSFE